MDGRVRVSSHQSVTPTHGSAVDEILARPVYGVSPFRTSSENANPPVDHPHEDR